jgi:hypothetical protein
MCLFYTFVVNAVSLFMFKLSLIEKTKLKKEKPAMVRLICNNYRSGWIGCSSTKSTHPPLPPHDLLFVNSSLMLVTVAGKKLK